MDFAVRRYFGKEFVSHEGPGGTETEGDEMEKERHERADEEAASALNPMVQGEDVLCFVQGYVRGCEQGIYFLLLLQSISPSWLREELQNVFEFDNIPTLLGSGVFFAIPAFDPEKALSEDSSFMPMARLSTSM